MNNTIIAIGGVSNYDCYLNVPLEEAKERYIKQFNEDPHRDKEEPFMTVDDIDCDIIKVLKFDDEFSAYDIED